MLITKKLFKNKWLELELSFHKFNPYNWFSSYCSFSTRGDHHGFYFTLGLIWLHFEFNIYDTRHDDYLEE